MRLVITACLHLHDRCPCDSTGLPWRLNDAEELAEKLLALSADVYVVAGDIFDSPFRTGKIEVRAKTTANQILERLSEKAAVFLIDGNHDIVIRSSDASPLSALNGMRWYTSGDSVVDLGGGVVLALMHNRKDADEAIGAVSKLGEQIPAGATGILVGHQQMIGSPLNTSGLVATDGVRRENLMVSPFRLSCFGHHHLGGQIHPRIWLVPSPYETRWDEVGKRNYVLSVDVKGRGEVDVERIETFPNRWQRLTAVKKRDTVQISGWTSRDRVRKPDNYVDVVMKGVIPRDAIAEQIGECRHIRYTPGMERRERVGKAGVGDHSDVWTVARKVFESVTLYSGDQKRLFLERGMELLES